MTGAPCDVAIALAHSGELISFRVSASRAQQARLQQALSHLLNLGHVAAFSIRPAEDAAWHTLLEQLCARCGSFVVGACIDPPAPPIAITPSFLMPVWAFDHEVGGLPASTGQLLGLDLELIATPSGDEEHGAHLPGRNGRWLIHARPLRA